MELNLGKSFFEINMLSTCGSTAAEEYIPFSDLWREICGKKSRKLQNNVSGLKQLHVLQDHATYVPVSKNPWTCLKNHGLCQVPISFSFPGSQQSTRLPVITTAWSGIDINVKVKKTLFVFICFCEIAINVKVRKNDFFYMILMDCHRCENAN